MNNPDQQKKSSEWKSSLRQAWLQIQTWFSKDPGEEAHNHLEKERAQTFVKTGKELKAGFAKAIQLLGYFEGNNTFTTSIAKSIVADLYDRIPGQKSEEIEHVFIEDFGKKPNELYTLFEIKPFAAASLGEVHYAKGRMAEQQNQTEYAVKIQYPQIAQALQQDLADESLLEKLMGASLGESLSPKSRAMIKQIILEELDYQKEAHFLTRFSQSFSSETQFLFPKVEPSLCSKRILTATFLPGENILSFLETASQEAKNQIGMNLLSYGLASPLIHQLINADPNPGNFLVMNQGNTLGLVDFGCCLLLTEDQTTCEQVFWQSLLAGDAEVFRYTLHQMGFIHDVVEFDSSTYRTWEQLLAKPFQSHSFLWTQKYAYELITTTQILMQGKRFSLSPDFLLLWRQRLGLISLLGKTQAQGNFRKLLFQILKTTQMEPKGMRI